MPKIDFDINLHVEGERSDDEAITENTIQELLQELGLKIQETIGANAIVSGGSTVHGIKQTRVEFSLKKEKDVPADQKHRVSSKSTKRNPTAADLLASGLIGMWKDRTDIGDSVEFARKLREKHQRRLLD